MTLISHLYYRYYLSGAGDDYFRATYQPQKIGRLQEMDSLQSVIADDRARLNAVAMFFLKRSFPHVRCALLENIIQSYKNVTIYPLIFLQHSGRRLHRGGKTPERAGSLPQSGQCSVRRLSAYLRGCPQLQWHGCCTGSSSRCQCAISCCAYQTECD